MKYNMEQREENSIMTMAFLQKRGYTKMQAAAITGNLLAESNINVHTKPGDEESARGIAQWHDVRATKFKEIIGKNIDDADLYEQLSFVAWEFDNSHKKAKEALLNATNLRDATAAVDKLYEGSAGLAVDKRVMYAQEQMDRATNEVIPPIVPPVVNPPVPTPVPTPAPETTKHIIVDIEHDLKILFKRVLHAILAIFERK